MIEFYLDPSSGVATYLQLVQQVHQALQLGLLEPGDQLPTAQQVVASLAINPNTVLKAYRDLEREGLVAARPGLGTFVVGRLPRHRPGGPGQVPQVDDGLAALGPLGRAQLGRDRGDLPQRVPRLLRRGGCGMTEVLEAVGLGKRYRRRWALANCTLSIPSGRVVGLVGPNGAGKTTLLHLAVGLLQPSAGTISVLGDRPGSGPGPLARFGFLAQDSPTYARLTVGEHLKMGGWLNPSWDDDVRERRIAELGLDPRQRAGTLSGGQRAQLALTLAVAKRPELLLLDEPVASLDPLARREFLQTLMEVVAEQGVSIVLSSHLIADLERICDYLVVLVAGRVALAGEVDELLASHHRLVGPRRDSGSLPADQTVIAASHADRQSTCWSGPTRPILDPAWTVTPVSLDDLILAYLKQARDGVAGESPIRSGGGPMIRFAWLQTRTQTVATAALFALAVLAALTGVHLAHLYTSLVTHCQSGCDLATSQFLHYNFLQHAFDILSQVAPPLIGLFWGAPLLAREFETGSYRLAWTQSVSRSRWLLTKLGLGALATATLAGLLTLTITWWYRSLDKVGTNQYSVFDRSGPGPDRLRAVRVRHRRVVRCSAAPDRPGDGRHARAVRVRPGRHHALDPATPAQPGSQGHIVASRQPAGPHGQPRLQPDDRRARIRAAQRVDGVQPDHHRPGARRQYEPAHRVRPPPLPEHRPSPVRADGRPRRGPGRGSRRLPGLHEPGVSQLPPRRCLRAGRPLLDPPVARDRRLPRPHSRGLTRLLPVGHAPQRLTPRSTTREPSPHPVQR